MRESERRVNLGNGKVAKSLVELGIWGMIKGSVVTLEKKEG